MFVSISVRLAGDLSTVALVNGETKRRYCGIQVLARVFLAVTDSNHNVVAVVQIS